MQDPQQPVIPSLLADVIAPVLAQLTRRDELDIVMVSWRTSDAGDGGQPTRDGLRLDVVLVGERASLPLWTPGEPELTDAERRSRLASDLQDFIAESRFAWGQLRAHDF